MVITFPLTAAAILYIVSTIVFDIGIIDILNNFMPRFDRGEANYAAKITIAYVLDLLTPLTLIGLWLAELMSRTKSGRTPTDASSKTIKKNKESRLSRFIAWSAGKAASISVLVAIVAGALVAYLCYDSQKKTLITVDYYASNKMWREVLEASNQLPNHKFIIQAVNHALYHTGRLGDDMFLYQQQPDTLLLYTEVENPMRWWRVSDTYIDLGHINIAEFMLNLAMETYGERPIILRRLALINMVKGSIGAARVYLGALSKTLFDAGWVRETVEKIEQDPNLSADKEVQYLRSIMPATNRDLKEIKENVFPDLLTKNKHNRMAFEYMAAFHLLTGKLDKFAGILNRIDDFDYGRIPREYEEAILLYKFMNKKDALRGREISSESRARFDGFCNIYFGRYRGNKAAAINELAWNYGDSYLFYAVYWHSGMKQ